MIGDFDCCHTWDNNPVIAERDRMIARADGYPAAPGHTLIIPKRHITGFCELSTVELHEMRALIQTVQDNSPATSWTIGVNDGPDAGRTVGHLHIHVWDRTPGDVPDPRGGVRQIMFAAVADDPWIRQAGGGDP